MIGIIPVVAIIVFIGLGFYIEKGETKISEIIMSWLASLVTTILGTMLFSLLVLVCIDIFETPTYTTKPICTWDIKSMKPDQEIHGNFTLGSGSINTTPVFYVLTYAGDGFWKKETFPTNASLITETDEKPYILREDTISHSKAFKFMFGFDHNWHTSQYKFYVPKGTIIEKYNIM